MPPSDELAIELPVAQVKAELFKAIGHPLRVRVLELLAATPEGEERGVGALADALGVEVGALSQQLGVLRRAGVVVAHKDGTTVHYALRDRGMVELLAVAKRMIVQNLRDSRALLAELESPAVRS